MPLEIQYSEKAEILDLTPYPKEMINEEFAIFGNREIRENNRCIYERDEHGLILINQTQYDVINIELSIFGERKTFWDAQIREGTVEVCPDNERIYHYSIRAKNPNLNMGLTICDRSTRVNLAFYERSTSRKTFSYNFTGIDEKGYLNFNPHFTSILSKIPIAKNLSRKKSIQEQRKEEYELQLSNQKANEITSPGQQMRKLFDQMAKGEMKDKMMKQFQIAEQNMKEQRSMKDDIEKYLGSGLQKYLDGDIEGAESDFHQTLKIEPQMYHADEYLGLVAMNLRRNYPKAEKLFQKALKSKHNKKETYYFLGMLMMVQERYVEAEKYFTLAMAARLNLCNAWNGMGNVLLYQGHLLEAGFYFSHAVDFFQKQRKARNSLEELIFKATEKYFKIKPPEDSLNDIKAVLQREPLRANVRDKPLYRRKMYKQDNPDILLLDEFKRLGQISLQIKVGDILRLYGMSDSKLKEKLNKWDLMEGYRVNNNEFVIENPVLFMNSIEFQMKNMHKRDVIKIERERAEMLLRSNQCRRCSKPGVPYRVVLVNQKGSVGHLCCYCNFCENCINQVRLDHPRNVYVYPGTSKEVFEKQILDKIRSLNEN
ncbi:MAG: tetratricopeptide repeat protein [Promethearchaeota archaeon]